MKLRKSTILRTAMIWLLLASQSFAAVALDALFTGGNADSGRVQQADNATSCSDTDGITVGASATLLVAVVHWQGQIDAAGPVSITATWDGNASTGNLTAQNSSGRQNTSAIFWWNAPATGAKTLTFNWTNGCDCYMSAASFTGTHATTPIVTADNVTVTAGTTVTVTSGSDDATVAVWGTNGGDPTTNFEEIFSQAPLDPGGGASYELGGTSNGHTFTGAGGTTPAGAGVHIDAAATGGGNGAAAYYYRMMMGAFLRRPRDFPTVSIPEPPYRLLRGPHYGH
jgi:hypothetical protein